MDNDLEIQSGTDFNMEEVDSMPQFVQAIDGVYKCSLSLKRDTTPKNDREVDTLIMQFVIDEVIEERKDHGISPEDLVYLRFSLLKTKRDIEEKRKDSFGLRMAKGHLMAIKNALGCGASLNEIIKEAQDVKCTATFATRFVAGKNKDGEPQEYANIDIKKLIVA